MHLTKTNNHQNRLLSVLLVTWITLLGSSGCSDPEEPIGSAVGPQPGGTLETKVFYADTSLSFTDDPVSTGGSAYVYTGSGSGVSTCGMFRFHAPYMPDNYALDVSRNPTVHIAYHGGLGTGNVNVLPEQIDFIWSEYDTLRLDLLPGPIDSVQVVPTDPVGADSGIYELTLDINWFAYWLSQADSNLAGSALVDSGLTILLRPDPGSTGRHVRFYSRTAPEDSITGPRKPRLYIPVTITDTSGNETSDSLEVIAFADLFIPTYADTVIRDRLIVGSGVPFISLLRFDVAEMWDLQESSIIVVNQAIVTLYSETVENPWPLTRSIWPFKLTNSEWITDPHLMEQAAFIAYTTAIDSTADSLGLLVTRPAADWIKSEEDNFGLALNSSGVGLDLDRVAFTNHDYIDPARRPKLTLQYTRIDR